MFRADAGSSPPDVGCELLSCDLHQAYPCVALHRFFSTGASTLLRCSGRLTCAVKLIAPGV